MIYVLALRWHGRRDVRLEEVEDPPPPGPGEVQLRILWCGICGTDVEEYRNGPIFIPTDGPHPLTGRSAPLTLGHEFCDPTGRGAPRNIYWMTPPHVLRAALDRLDPVAFWVHRGTASCKA